jgi:NADPH-dependent glutamate synthase beta subunit-like oxidoreductase
VLDIVRGDWERAHRELEEQKRNPRRYRQLLSAVEAVTQALRTRVGQTYTLEQLAQAYADVERWGRDAVEEHAQYEGWARDLALVEDAAFHDYARGALNFEP